MSDGVISIRGGSGLGDSLYVQAIARHFVRKGHLVEACSDWPDVFAPLGNAVTVSSFRRDRVDRVAHYSMRRREPETDQFADCCIEAGLAGENVTLKLDWRLGSQTGLSLRSQAGGKPIIAVQLPRTPMDRKDGYGAELLPECAAIQAAIDALRGKVFIVQVGRGRPLYQFSGIDLDLANATTVPELLDVVAEVDGCLGYCSFLIPLAESLGVPGLMVWSRRGRQSPRDLVKALTPRKVIHRKDLLRAVMDDAGADALRDAAHALLEQIRSPLAA